MYLRKITLVVITAMILSFSIRLLGTFFPRIFMNVLMVKATILINAMFILCHLLFWLVFYQKYISVQKITLKKTCALAVLGSFAVSFIYIKELPFVFGMTIHFPLLFMSPYFDALVPLISATFHLVFFITFIKSLEPEEKSMLNKPVLSMVSGILLYILLHLFVLFNFLATDRFAWLEHMPRAVALGTVPIIVAAVLLMLYFYYQFYFFITLREKTLETCVHHGK